MSRFELRLTAKSCHWQTTASWKEKPISARNATARLGYFWDEPIAHVACVDEAGCGPLAGLVAAAAVILDKSRWMLDMLLNFRTQSRGLSAQHVHPVISIQDPQPLQHVV